jgi:hypothetical protein
MADFIDERSEDQTPERIQERLDAIDEMLNELVIAPRPKIVRVQTTRNVA